MKPRIFRPPVVAVWLVGLFIPAGQGEAIQGDLAEEYSRLALASDVAAARRWYWRQSISTVTHLLGSGFCAAPWLIAGVVLGGCLALWFGLEWGDLTLIHFNANLHAHGLRMFWPWEIQVERFVVMMLVGCLVALAVKGREMVAAITLSLVCAALSGLAYPAWTIVRNPESALPVRVFQLTASIAILLGAAITREIRFVLSRRHRSVRPAF